MKKKDWKSCTVCFIFLACLIINLDREALLVVKICSPFVYLLGCEKEGTFKPGSNENSINFYLPVQPFFLLYTTEFEEMH